jgi:membrane associated rhomboid family serine protease
MSARRWPIITLALLVTNVVVFLGTHWVMEKQDPQLEQVRSHILILAARHPQLTFPSAAREWIDAFRNYEPDDWAEMQRPNYKVIDEWDARTRQLDDPVALQTEMDSLADEYSSLMASSISERYGFVLAHPRAIEYLTSNFLHVGWWHLIGNMWFLWLAGFVLEDAWGRPLYLLVYLTAGAVACQFDVWANPESLGCSIGASGAIAGLMGAFLARFPTMRIQMMWFFDFGGFRRFWMRAYWLLPLWVLVEINDGMRPSDGIGHWAHVGGFLFGAVAAGALRYSGLENKMDKAIEERLAWAPAMEVTRAADLMERREFGEATAILNEYLAANPESFPALNLLRSIHWQRSDIPAYREATIKLCALHLQAREYEAAWEDYEDFLQLGGERMPPDVWLGLCRVPEEREQFDRALSEYEKLTAAYPSERQSLLAQLSAARICLQHIGRPLDALRLFEAASNSPVPHLDLELDIESGRRRSGCTVSAFCGCGSRSGSAHRAAGCARSSHGSTLALDVTVGLPLYRLPVAVL